MNDINNKKINIYTNKFNNKIKPNSKFLSDLEYKIPEFFNRDNSFNMNKFRRALLKNNIHELKDGYRLNFIGKDYARQQTGELPHTVIVPNKKHNEKNINKKSKNLYFSGDNLEGLRHLQTSYYNKIDAIYIDPPFNTGSNNFIYPDKFDLSDKALKSMFELTNNQLNQLKSIQGTSTHSAWLTFMYPRLFLAKKLLKNHGLIFISIDDNEQANLKLLMNDIYGENDFVSQISVEMSKTQGMKVKAGQNGEIVGNKQYILIYEINNNGDYRSRQPLYDYNPNYDSHFSKILTSKNKLVNLCDYICNNMNESMIKSISRKIGKRFTVNNLSEFLRIIPDISTFINIHANRIYNNAPANFNIPSNIKSKVTDSIHPVSYKKYLLIRTRGNKIRQLLPLKSTFHHTDDLKPKYGRSIIRGDFWKGFNADMMNINKEGNVIYKNGKKPVRLIQQLLKWSGIKNGIIMDFFAGSATTADAVMRNNDKFNLNNSYIMMQINTPIKHIKSKAAKKALKYGYKTLDQIGITRILNSSKQIIKDDPLKSNKLDLGFKHFYIVSPNIKLLNTLSLNDLSLNNKQKQLKMFDPDNIIQSFSSKALNVQGDSSGFDTILSTFIIDDGYGANVTIKYFNLNGYKLPVVNDEEAYILSSTWSNIQTQELLNLIITKKIVNIQTVDIFMYTVNFADIKELENGLNQLGVHCTERY